MSNWKCPIEEIDEDIREIVRLLYENNMKPYMSCSGSYKDHKDKQYWPECAYIELLDSPSARELIAMLIKDKKFKCSISKERECLCYSNNLPTGLRFKIEFDNICGEMQEILMALVQAVLQGKKAETDDKRKIDIVCDLIDTFDVTNGGQMLFSFNNEMIMESQESDDNYSIEIEDRKDFGQYYKTIDHAVNGFEQDKNGCRIYGNDFFAMVSVLKKIMMDYDKIPNLKYRENVRLIQSDSRRTNRFTANYREKVKLAQKKLEKMVNKKLFETDPSYFESFLKMFSDDD